MWKVTIEFDFLGIQKEASKSRFRKFLDRRTSFRGMQSGISRMDPPVVKSVMNSQCHDAAPPLQTAPFTIFYNGGVAVFDLPRDQRISAEQVSSKGRDPVGNTKSGLPSSSAHQLLDTPNGDLSLACKKSLQRFLEKRKERLSSI